MIKDPKLEELEKRRIWPLLVSYSLPAIVGMAAMSVYNLIDAIYIGQWCGTFAIAATALVFPITNLMVAVGTLVGLGGASTASITLGQRKMPRAFRVLGNCVLMSLFFGIVVGWLPLLWLDDILRLFMIEGETMEPARDFMLPLMLAFPISTTFMNLNHIMRASGYPKKAMVNLLLSMVVNIAVAPVYMLVFDWGIAGAALATATAQTAGLLSALRHYGNKRSVLHFKRGIFTPEWPLMRRVCSLGLPPCLLNIVGCVVVVVYNLLLLKYYNEDGGLGQMGVAAYGVANRVILFFCFIAAGIPQGMQPIAGYNLGMGNYKRVRQVLAAAIIFATAFTGIGMLLVQAFPREIVTMFAREMDANSTYLIDIATHGIRLYAAAFIMVGAGMVIANFFQAIGRPIMSIFLNLTRQCVFLLPCLIILPPCLGTNGIWVSQAIADALAGFFAITVVFVFFKKVFHKKDVTLPGS